MVGTFGIVNGWKHDDRFVKRFDRARSPATLSPPIFSNHMGKQYNKVEKKRRRLNVIKRKKAAAKVLRATKPKPIKKAPVKKAKEVAIKELAKEIVEAVPADAPVVE
jgi:chromatin segregation and condensation protein Rec8/ScpA/Scc1 (kleisin family)